MAAILPQGMRAISTEISAETGAGGFILPNDRVDVILSRRDKEAEKTTGVETVFVSETILNNVRVPRDRSDGRGKERPEGAWSARPRPLKLQPGQAETLALSRQLGTLSLALRSIVDANAPERRCRATRRAAAASTWSASASPLTDADSDSREGTRDMARRTLIRTASLAALVAHQRARHDVGLRRGRAARAGVPPGGGLPMIQVVGSDARSRFLPLGLGKSVVIDLPRDIKDVLVADPKIANAVIRSVRRAYIIGVAVGQTNIYFFDAEGRQIAGFDIAVTRDLNGMRARHQAAAAQRRHPRRRHRQ